MVDGQWGTAIDEQRMEWLRSRLALAKSTYPSHQSDQKPPFAGQSLTGAEVFWLTVQVLAGPQGDLTAAERRLQQAATNPLLRVSLDLSAIDLRGAVLSGAHLEGAILGRVRLGGATLAVAHLEAAYLGEADLTGTFMDRAYMERCYLGNAHLCSASLWAVNLQGASLYAADLQDAILHLADLRDTDLRSAHLDRADLSEVRLQDANLTEATLRGTSLYEAQLEGAVLSKADLFETDLRRTTFDSVSRLNGAHLDQAKIDQSSFIETNLAVIDWPELKRLGDETLAHQRRLRLLHYDLSGRRQFKTGRRKPSRVHMEEYRTAARAYRSLSVALRNQGLARTANRFHYRAEVMSRRSSYFEGITALTSLRFFLVPYLFGAWLISLTLSIVAGYGVYHVWRLFLTYLAVIATFAGLYYVFGQQDHPATTVINAVVLSLTSFHGRGLQPPVQLTDTISIYAAIEAVLGLVVEALFIGSLTRRITGL
jgi:uncharacterized protein YjbI with pentapeptide repeats